MHRFLTILFPVTIAFGLVLYQTPTDGSAPTAACPVPPLELPLFGGTPAAIMATPQASPQAEEMTPAEAESIVQGFIACVNSGDNAQIWAIFTPRWLASHFLDPETHYQPAFEQMLDTPVFNMSEPLTLVSVDGISTDPQGRVVITATFRSANVTWVDHLAVVQVNGVWLIDDVASITNPEESCPTCSRT